MELTELVNRYRYFVKQLPVNAPFVIRMIAYKEPPISSPLALPTGAIRLTRTLKFQLCLVASRKISQGEMVKDNLAFSIKLPDESWDSKHPNHTLYEYLSDKSIDDNCIEWNVLAAGSPCYHCKVLYPAFTLMNHSCRPNGKILYEICNSQGEGWYWIALKDIQAGTELLIDYQALKSHADKKLSFRCCWENGNNLTPYERPQYFSPYGEILKQVFGTENMGKYLACLMEEAKKHASEPLSKKLIPRENTTFQPDAADWLNKMACIRPYKPEPEPEPEPVFPPTVPSIEASRASMTLASLFPGRSAPRSRSESFPGAKPEDIKPEDMVPAPEEKPLPLTMPQQDMWYYMTQLELVNSQQAKEKEELLLSFAKEKEELLLIFAKEKEELLLIFAKEKEALLSFAKEKEELLLSVAKEKEELLKDKEELLRSVAKEKEEKLGLQTEIQELKTQMQKLQESLKQMEAHMKRG